MDVPETRYTRAPDGVQIAYQVTGGGNLDLVLMQGAVTHLELQWEDSRLTRFFERLSAFSRLIRFDRRGMGMSEALQQLPTFEEQLGDFGVVMDAVGSERAALMGNIDAGILALAFAEAHPERTRALIAFEVTPRFARSEADNFGVDPEMVSRMAQAIQAMDIETMASIVAPARVDEPGYLSWFRRYTRSGWSGIPIGAFLMMAGSWDVTGLLPRIEVPVLVLSRAENVIVPIRNGRALAAALPDARLVEIPGTGAVIWSADVDLGADEIEAFLTGTRPPPRRDRVLATVLFTDIVGSTDTAARMGDRDWRELLGRHNRVVRASLERYDGREIHTAGDGFLATFDSPRRAIECARAATSAVRSIGVEIRAGLHTGEIELAGNDVQGIAVHIGARVSAKAGAGEVLVSSTVKDLVVGSGIDFEDRGTHTLKGVPGEWRLFAVAG
ncbi:MAG TPA: adenylate/guanylate cyclase domain-containing protein [Actinomycetota bacterium]|nr:adenylate/guanylate cyclase domain-containing protein [Actinomycetota bacterium]